MCAVHVELSVMKAGRRLYSDQSVLGNRELTATYIQKNGRPGTVRTGSLTTILASSGVSSCPMRDRKR